MGAAAPTCTEANFAPIGTGPFVAKEFRTNDVAIMVANPISAIQLNLLSRN